MDDRTRAVCAVAAEQSGIVARFQLLELGLTPAHARRDLENGRWHQILPGVYATFTGPIPPIGRVWAAVLYAGRGAAVTRRSALWLAGVVDDPPDTVQVAVPPQRRVRRQAGIRVFRSAELLQRAAIGALPRLRVEPALLDQLGSETAEGAVDLVLRAIQRRTTTAPRLRTAVELRTRQRWRRLVAEVLDDAGEGVQSPLERRYLVAVERGHRLPAGERNRIERAASGAAAYRDVRYRPWNVVVELDGREAHPIAGAFRDLRRDNAATVAGESVLRYGWRDVVGRPCVVAAQVGAVLRFRGWPGSPTPCGRGCAARAA